MRRIVSLFLLFATTLLADSKIVQLADLVNLRNVATNNSGSDVVFVTARTTTGDPDTSTNLYLGQVTPTGTAISRLTNYQNGEFIFGGITGVDHPGNGSRVVYSYTQANGDTSEEVHLFDYGSRTDQVVAVDRAGCALIVCTDCLTTCIRSVHISPDAGSVLYAVARTSPFYTPGPNGVPVHLGIYDGSLAPSGHRVISQTGRFVFVSSAPAGPTFAAQPADVYTAKLDGTDVQQVTHLSSINQNARDAVISADGTQIAFTVVITSGTSTSSQVWNVRPDGTGLRQLSDTSINGTNLDATSPSISADGRVVTFLQDGQIKQIPTTVIPGALPVRAVAITLFTVSAALDAVVSGDGNQAAMLLGPRGGFPGGVYATPVAASRTYPQLVRVFTPKILFPLGLLSVGGFAAPSVGSLMTAYGTNLGNDELTVAGSFPLNTSMGGLEMLADLVPMPLQAVTPWQINAQLAQDRLPGTASFRVRTSPDLWPEARVNVLATAPEAIPIPLGGVLLAAAVYPGTKTLVDSTHPAKANDVLEIYTIGLGATTPFVAAGVVSPSSPPAQAKVTPRLQIGGVDASISFAGLVPGLAGVYQVNATVPSGIAPGFQPLKWVAANGSTSGSTGIYLH